MARPDRGAAIPNIPAKFNRKWRPCFSKTFYRERNQIERFFGKLIIAPLVAHL